MNKTFNQGDVMLLKQGWSGAQSAYVYVGRTAQGMIKAVSLGNRKTYRLKDDAILGVIGFFQAADYDAIFDSISEDDAATPDLAATLTAAAATNSAGIEGLRLAKQQAILKTVKNGDPIQMRIRGIVEDHKFVRHLPRGLKYTFVTENPNGTRYKWPVEAIHVAKEALTA